MKVSVIIPSYRPGNYVYECLDSLMNQSLDALRFEVIVVLNGTRDPYWEQLSRYAKRHGNIRLLHEAVAGVSNARNVGMKHAWGDFFAFVDDDDVVSSNYLEELLKISTPTILGVSNVHSFVDSVDNWDNDFFACKVIQEQRNLKSLFKNRSILSFPVAKLIHRDMVCGRQFDVRFANGEDSLFITKISDKIIGFAFTDLSACYFVRCDTAQFQDPKHSKGLIFVDQVLCIHISGLSIQIQFPFVPIKNPRGDKRECYDVFAKQVI